MLKSAAAAAALVTGAGMTQAQAVDEITIAYFLEWPMPF
jgi:taurine transport system substrate-binding protein